MAQALTYGNSGVPAAGNAGLPAALGAPALDDSIRGVSTTGWVIIALFFGSVMLTIVFWWYLATHLQFGF